MKYNINKAIIYSVIFIAIYSCTSMEKIAIQVSVPSKHPISPEIQSIAILNRSMTLDFINLQDDSIDKRLKMSFIKTYYDSIAAETAIKVAARAIYDTQRFDVVIPLERNIWRDDFGSLPLAPLDSASINQLCKDFKVDGVLVLESFSERVDQGYYTRETNSFQYLFTGVIDLRYKLDWRFYQPGKNPPVIRIKVSDAIFWDSGRSYRTPKDAYDKLPGIKEALIGGGIASGLDIADSICPLWVDETRYYCITGNEKADAAIPLIKLNKWEEAAEIWMKYSSASSTSLRSKIEFNLALAAEMTGDVDRAIEWGAKSLKTKYSKDAELYLLNLSRRPINQSRYYYITGNQDIDAAVPFFKLKKWDEAADIWKKYYLVPDKMLRSKVEYNLALTEEMKGSIDLAIKWGDKSLKTNNTLSTKQYLRELKEQYRFNKVIKNSNHRTSNTYRSTESSIIPWNSDGLRITE